VLLFNVAHTGIQRIAPAWDIDYKYASTLRQAIELGVEVLAYRSSISSEKITLDERIEFSVESAAS
jgi:sugar fermentation stimulation protein A